MRTTDPPDNHITLTIPPNAAYTDQVRTSVRNACCVAGIAPDDGETLVTELFANVIKHATGQGQAPVTIDLAATDEFLSGAVHDRDTRIPTIPAAVPAGGEGSGYLGNWSDVEDGSGWGLGLVASLCIDGWFKFEPEEGGKAAVFCLPAVPSKACACPADSRERTDSR
jgi:anti-sigma regulatory factor (Ser/Thr protein kinase)